MWVSTGRKAPTNELLVVEEVAGVGAEPLEQQLIQRHQSLSVVCYLNGVIAAVTSNKGVRKDKFRAVLQSTVVAASMSAVFCRREFWFIAASFSNRVYIAFFGGKPSAQISRFFFYEAELGLVQLSRCNMVSTYHPRLICHLC